MSRLPPHKFVPVHDLYVISLEGISKISKNNISSEIIGWKAYGLTALPFEWVPPFFVLAADCLNGSVSNDMLQQWVTDCCNHVGISTTQQVIVRSSGTSETIRERGRLLSKTCGVDNVVVTISKLIPQLIHGIEGKVHWIVQEYSEPRAQGQLSNERRLKEEKRDWVVEFESQQDRQGYIVSMGVRLWRDGRDFSIPDLSSASETEVALRLKRVAMWATQFSIRILFEWVWDGRAVKIVQADIADSYDGSDPRSFLPSRIPSVGPAALSAFRVANEQDYEKYRKLRNAKLYIEYGYAMPPFFILDDPDILAEIASGTIPSALECDLNELTKRPFIVRTDGNRVPIEKHEMLPRSDELRSSTMASEWLLTRFNREIKQNGLIHSDLALIAHHFIPSLASAWARAEPGNRIVRIESLWGIPEGLYWYSHDTFEVDTQTVALEQHQAKSNKAYKYRQRLRYKGTFIAPNGEGEWVSQKTASPFDWGKSIQKEDWLFEIAHTTRRIAEQEQRAVAVMWFVGNHKQATGNSILPWFHSESRSVGSPKAAPRKKYNNTSEYKIRSENDWELLKQRIFENDRIERVIVEPIEPGLVRNNQFVQDLASLAISGKFVVELSGGILSHAYHVLQREGAQVECVDLFGINADVVEYNKIVRDKIPDFIEERGEKVELVQLKGEALVTALRRKLVEEAFEALDAKSGPELIDELADVKEVIIALCNALNTPPTQIEEMRLKKRKDRGGFDKGLMLTKTTTPHSIQKQPVAPISSLNLQVAENAKPVISEEADIPARPKYRRPDLRQVDRQLERLFTFETEVNRIDDKIGENAGTLGFSLKSDDNRQQDLSLTVEIRRTKSLIRGVVRLRFNAQLELDLSDPNNSS